MVEPRRASGKIRRAAPNPPTIRSATRPVKRDRAFARLSQPPAGRPRAHRCGTTTIGSAAPPIKHGGIPRRRSADDREPDGRSGSEGSRSPDPGKRRESISPPRETADRGASVRGGASRSKPRRVRIDPGATGRASQPAAAHARAVMGADVDRAPRSPVPFVTVKKPAADGGHAPQGRRPVSSTGLPARHFERLPRMGCLGAADTRQFERGREPHHGRPQTASAD
jgi:hypothetical protein